MFLSILLRKFLYFEIEFRSGCAEMRMARHVEELAARTAGKEALAIEGFARALRQIPIIIADNGGYDSSQLVSELRAMHSQDKVYSGLNMVTGEVGNIYRNVFLLLILV